MAFVLLKWAFGGFPQASCLQVQVPQNRSERQTLMENNHFVLGVSTYLQFTMRYSKRKYPILMPQKKNNPQNIFWYDDVIPQVASCFLCDTRDFERSEVPLVENPWGVQYSQQIHTSLHEHRCGQALSSFVEVQQECHNVLRTGQFLQHCKPKDNLPKTLMGVDMSPADFRL